MSLQVNQLIGFGSGGGPQAYTFIGSCRQVINTVDFGTLSAGAVAAGDLLVYVDFCHDSTGTAITSVTPSGFTNILDNFLDVGATSARGMISIKKADGTEGVIAGIAGSSDARNKIGLCFRPDQPFTTPSANDTAVEITATNPASQNCDPSAETVATIVIGAAGIDSATAAFSTASPAFDGTVLTTSSDLIVGYKIYNTAPAAHNIDMNDLGDINWLASMYLKTV